MSTMHSMKRRTFLGLAAAVPLFNIGNAALAGAVSASGKLWLCEAQPVSSTASMISAKILHDFFIRKMPP